MTQNLLTALHIIIRIRNKVHEFTVQVMVQGDFSCRESQNSKDSRILTVVPAGKS